MSTSFEIEIVLRIPDARPGYETVIGKCRVDWGGGKYKLATPDGNVIPISEQQFTLLQRDGGIFARRKSQ